MSNRIERCVRSLRAERQEPLCAYIYDLDALRAHVRGLLASLPPRCNFFYAMKANAERPILQALAPLVHGFEVASLGEVRKGREIDAGIPLIFGGPGKHDAEIEGALELGVTQLHVESLHELLRVEAIGRRLGRVVPILLRANLRGPLPAATLQMAGRPTQFGIDEALLPEAIMQARESAHIDLQGFHFHSISNQLDAAAHTRLVAYYIERAKEWAARYGLALRLLNAGGGIGVNYRNLSAPFPWEEFTRGLARELEQLPAGCTLQFECGRYVAASCGYYAAEVLDIKRNHGHHYLIVRGGTHHFRLPASWQHSHPFSIVPIEEWRYDLPRPTLQDSTVTIAGQLCSPKDLLAREQWVERVRVGDLILFHHAGAYGWSISHHDFLSHPHPEHLYLDGDTSRVGASGQHERLPGR